MPLLEVRGLKTYYYVYIGTVRAVDNVSFSINKGDSFGLAGESGCGKTTVALSLMRLIKPPGKIVEGEVVLDGRELLKLSTEELRRIRWKGMSLVFQGALNALNPVHRVGDQIVEAIVKHQDMEKKEARSKARSLLDTVGIDPSRYDNYPHEFSGGMKQRATIAMALSCEPDLIIMDEPLTALDVVAGEQTTRLLYELRQKLNMSMIFISHDLSFIARNCTHVAIMYAGKIVEKADVLTMFKKARHPYSIGLVGSFPSIRSSRTSFKGIEGSPPSLIDPPQGCRFWPRCYYKTDICMKEEPQEMEIEPEHFVACYHIDKTIQ